jgi:protein involved in polysaccharide export with SLBB domain
MTTSEIATTLRKKIKLFEDPAVVVNVRDYASHTVTISGFVAAPGTKTLRREAVPLYALLAESLVLPDAARATITHSGNTIAIDLKDPTLSAALILPGDVIKVLGPAPGPTEFFFVAGEVKLPGQKPYHSGLTLTQAILAGGGATNGAGERVRVSRQGTDGRLVTEEFNLRKIQDGKLADPLLQKDDRIELAAAN